MNAEDFVTYEQALALKKLGFDCRLHTYYDEDGDFMYDAFTDNFNSSKIFVTAPTLAQVAKWLRINKKLYVQIFFRAEHIWYALVINTDKPEIVGHTENCNSYEEALLAGITECIKFLNNR